MMASSNARFPRKMACWALLISMLIVPAVSVYARGQTGQSSWKEISAREQILSTITENPGIHFRAIMETVNRSNGVAQYHLRQMEINHDVFSVNFGHLKGFLPVSLRKLKTKEQLALVAMRHPLRNAISESLLDGAKSATEIAAACEEDLNKVAFHLRKLVDAGILHLESTSSGMKYALPAEIKQILEQFAIIGIAKRNYAFL